MDYLDFSIAPSHWLKPFHPRYNSNSDYDAYKNAMPPNDLPVPTKDINPDGFLFFIKNSNVVLIESSDS